MVIAFSVVIAPAIDRDLDLDIDNDISVASCVVICNALW